MQVEQVVLGRAQLAHDVVDALVLVIRDLQLGLADLLLRPRDLAEVIAAPRPDFLRSPLQGKQTRPTLESLDDERFDTLQLLADEAGLARLGFHHRFERGDFFAQLCDLLAQDGDLSFDPGPPRLEDLALAGHGLAGGRML
jgi:hypothetical protein